VTSAGGVVLLTVHAGWAASRPLELDYDVLETGHDVSPEGVVSAPSGAVASGDAAASFDAPTPPVMPSCERPSTLAGAVGTGCVVVAASWTFSLDDGRVTSGPADLWFEAATETDSYLTRSFDWPGPSTSLRLVSTGGREACLDALAEPDPSPATWPVPSTETDVVGPAHGIPFRRLEGDATACATSLAGHVFEVRLAGAATGVAADGTALPGATFTWIDWGAWP
jgi:hypothetical protein